MVVLPVDQRDLKPPVAQRLAERKARKSTTPVSYTHLTLPTIYSV